MTSSVGGETPLDRPPIALQIQRGQLVCPRTRQRLRIMGERLQNATGEWSYPLLEGVPFLIADQERVAVELAKQGGNMVAEYSGKRRFSIRKAWDRIANRVGDMRSPASQEAFHSIFAGLGKDALCISVGGGPQRAHPALVNVNLGIFPNVDVAGDAYELPYAKGVVDAVHCEAVLEHLEFPDRAVAEMYRVLRPGGQLFAATPFLQVFHGYPDHYQNFTLTGHVRLFERAGLSILSAGTCVGPSFALRDLTANFFRKIVPAPVGKLASILWSITTLPFLYFDQLANQRPQSVEVASTTYVHAVKKSTQPEREPP